jgi:hypothetical protein
MSENDADLSNPKVKAFTDVQSISERMKEITDLLGTNVMAAFSEYGNKRDHIIKNSAAVSGYGRTEISITDGTLINRRKNKETLNTMMN